MRRNLLAVLLAVTLVFASVSTQAGFTGPLTVGLSRALTYGLSQIEDADGFVGYLLNALGFNTGSTAQTITAPDPVLALDWEGTLTDFGGAVNASGDSVAPPVGSRMTFDISEAVVGVELVDTQTAATFSVIANNTVIDDGAEVKITYVDSDLGVNWILRDSKGLTQDLVVGETYNLSGLTRVNLGSVRLFESGTSTTIDTITSTTLVPFSYQFTATSTTGHSLRQASFSTGEIIWLSSLSLKQILPTVLDTDTSGNPLHPSVTTGSITDYVFYPTHEVSTAYSSDKFIWAEASDGSTRYYSSSGGTSAGSAPTFPTSGTVVDNDITWTYEGRYGLSGQRVEGAATQYLLNSETPATQTTGILSVGDYVLWMEGTGSADLTAGTATISTTGSATDGTPLTFSVTVAGTVTVTVAGTEDRIQLEGGDFPTSIIQSVASTVTRSAVNLTVPTSETGLTAAEGAGRMIVTPLASGQSKYLLSSYVDPSNNFTLRILTGTIVSIQKEAANVTEGAAKPYNTIAGEQAIIDFSWSDVDGIEVNAWSLGTTAGAKATYADTRDTPLTTTMQIGARINDDHFNATYDSVKFYPNAAAAAADLDDWSLNSIWGYDTDDFGRLIPADADVIYGQAYAEAA